MEENLDCFCSQRATVVLHLHVLRFREIKKNKINNPEVQNGIPTDGF